MVDTDRATVKAFGRGFASLGVWKSSRKMGDKLVHGDTVSWIEMSLSKSHIIRMGFLSRTGVRSATMLFGELTSSTKRRYTSRNIGVFRWQNGHRVTVVRARLASEVLAPLETCMAQFLV